MSLSNGWTGGQYSLFRAVFGFYLLVHYIQLIPWGAELFSSEGVLPEASLSPLSRLFPNVLLLWDSPSFVVLMLAGAAVCSVFFALGRFDRIAAATLWYVGACLIGRNPLISNPALPYVGWLLLAHACLSPAPYGAWSASGRSDPGGGWRMPGPLFAAAWVLMAVGYSYSGWTKLISPSWVDGTAVVRILENPLARPTPLRLLILEVPGPVLRLATWGTLALELAFAPLALVGRLRPWLWAAMLAMHGGLIVLIDFADLSLGMAMVHLFTFDPAWIRRRGTGVDTVLYDGRCGLCHRAVRYLLAEDEEGKAFRYAPLGGVTFQAAIPEDVRSSLPDSIVVRTAAGEILTRSAAFLHMWGRLGGAWRLLAGILRWAPRPVRDAVYDVVARIRRRLFSGPAEWCPLVPLEVRSRFDP